TGFLAGFLYNIPVGPINISIINEGAQRGFVRATLIGAGAMVMDATYCALGFAGASTLLDSRYIRAALELISFLLMIFLGLKYLLAPKIPKISHSAEIIEQKLNPHTAFMTGFVRMLGNPSVLLLWIALAATFTAHQWVDPPIESKLACVLGVGVGAQAWFTLLAWGASLGHQKLSEKTLLRLSHASGLGLLLLSLYIGWRLVTLLARH
ncbi:MAG: LysE family transporter, partial [Verrucomicrobia bacterium]|nr:LysE family transporter [Verrucomicrobiota bacterium]